MTDAEAPTVTEPDDVSWGAFSSDAPWVLPSDQLPWQRAVAAG